MCFITRFGDGSSRLGAAKIAQRTAIFMGANNDMSYIVRAYSDIIYS